MDKNNKDIVQFGFLGRPGKGIVDLRTGETISKEEAVARLADDSKARKSKVPRRKEIAVPGAR